MSDNWHKKEIKRSLSDNELYIGWMQDLDYIILYESDLIKMLNKMRKFKKKERKKSNENE